MGQINPNINSTSYFNSYNKNNKLGGSITPWL